MSKMQLILFITAIMLVGTLALPAYAQTTINGTVPFDPNNTDGIGNVTGLTVYALGTSGENKTTPNADGTFSISVPGNDTYSIKVVPSKLNYVNKTTNASYTIQYPDGISNVLPILVSNRNITGIVIPTFYVSYPTITGTIPFDPNNYNNVNSVTQLTIYAINQSGFETKANPKADGTFSMTVVGNGTYSFRVIPSKLDYLNATTNATYTIQYPDAVANKFIQNVPDTGLNTTIPAWNLQTGVPTGMPPTVTPTGTTVSPPATPGFTMLAVLAALGAAAAIAFRKR